MVELGVVLFIIGVVVALLVHFFGGPAEVQKLGYVLAVIGIVVVIVALLLGAADEAGDRGVDGDALVGLPLAFLASKLRR